MKLVGFGCSFTYGSELHAPQVDPGDHWANTRYRTQHTWLGVLARLFACSVDMRAEPGNSNFAIAQQVADYFNRLRNSQEHIVVCVGWTESSRMSWYSDRWVHLGFAQNTDTWRASAREWRANATDDTHQQFTDCAKLTVNSICQAHGVPILQFNALGTHPATRYSNYFLDGTSMNSMLAQAEREDSRLNLFANGGHPNEQGHEYFAIRLHEFAKERII